MKTAQTRLDKGFAPFFLIDPLFLSPCSYSELLYMLPYLGNSSGSINHLRTGRKQIAAQRNHSTLVRKCP
jgi:hypothetical protein